MRTSLNELRDAEFFLSGKMPQDEASLFRAKMILYPELRSDTNLLKKTLVIIRSIGRRHLRSEIQTIEQILFHQQEHRDFQGEIEAIFLKQ